MPLMAVVLPILPGKTPEWRAWMEEATGPRYEEFAESRSRAGVHERTFLQSTPMGDFVILTLEGEDPGRSFGQLMSGTDSFSTWFRAGAMAAHGDLDLPTDRPLSVLVADSERVPAVVA
jgi:hypothetical protein